MTDPNVIIRLRVDGDEQVIPAFRRTEGAARRAGRGVATGLRPGERAVRRFREEARGAAQGVDQLGRSAGSVGRLGRAIGGLRGVLGAAGLTVGAAALVTELNQASSAVAEIGDRADRLNLDPVFLQQIQQVQIALGQSPDGLEESLFSFTRRIGEARAGAQEAVRIFDALGVELEDQNGVARSTDAVFRDVADAIRGIEDPTQRAAIAQRLFEEGGRRLLPLLQSGADQFDRLADRADEAGNIFGNDLVRESQAAQVALNNLTEQTLNPITAAFARAANQATFFFERLLLGRDLQSVGTLVDELGGLNAQIAELEEEFALGDRGDAGGNRRQRRQASVASRVRDQLGELLAERQRVTSELRNRGFAADGSLLEVPVDDAGGGAGALELDLSSGGGRQGARVSAQQRAEDRLRNSLAQRLEVGERELRLIELQGVERVILSARIEAETLRRQLNNAATEDGSTLTDEETAALSAQIDAIEASAVALERRKASIEAQEEAERDLAEQSEEFNRSLEGSIDQLVTLGLEADNTRDLLTGLLGVLRDLITEGLRGEGVLGGVLGGALEGPNSAASSFLQQLAGGIGGLFGGGGFSLSGAGAALGGGFSAAGVAPVLSFPGFAKGAAFSRSGPIEAFERGGIFDRPTFFNFGGGRRGVMAEAGEEAVMPLVRTSDGSLGVRAAGGGQAGAVRPVFNIFGPVDERVASRLPSLTREAGFVSDGEAARRVERGQQRGT